MDTNFDELADRFERRVYGGLKGEIRLSVIWRDLLPRIEEMEVKNPRLRILDVGGGLAQISQRLAARGHTVLYNDLSATMLEKAAKASKASGVEGNFTWHHGSYSELAVGGEDAHFDLVLCHALIEWLAQPAQLFPVLERALRPDGLLSLCYYNPAGKVYRNLIRGNFDLLNDLDNYQSDRGSLTPNNPCEREQVLQWLGGSRFEVIEESGIRVFHDYVVERRGGHQSDREVLAMELRYSQLEPYKRLGRYQHVLARQIQTTPLHATSPQATE